MVYMSGDEEVVYDWGKLLCIPLRVSSRAGLRRRGDNVSWNRYVRQYVVIEWGDVHSSIKDEPKGSTLSSSVNTDSSFQPTR